MQAWIIALMVAGVAACSVPSSTPVLYDSAEYATHNEQGERYCSILGGTSVPSCFYRLDELEEIEGGAVGVRVYGFLVRRNGDLHLSEVSDGSGAAVPITAIDPRVDEWMPSIMEGYFTAINGRYDPSFGGLEVSGMGRPDIPGLPRPDLPPPEKR